MKILLSSFQCVPNQGSELGNGWHWARALADCGHDVTVLTQESHLIRAAAPPDIKFLHVDPSEPPLRRLFGTAAYYYQYYLRWQDAALRYVEKQPQRYDVVHHVSWGSLHLGCQLWRLPTPLVYGPIGGGQTAPGNYWRYFGRGWPSELLRTASTGAMLRLNSRSRDTVRNSAVTLVTNSATAAACQRLGATDVRYMLAEGLPREWLVAPRSRPAGIPVVLWVGRLLPRKAPILAVQAFAGLRRAMHARLVVAGDGPLMGQVRTMVDRLGLTDDVQLLGRVPWEELKSHYDSASVFLFTSLRDSSGSQFLEALSRGLPAVALDHHGIGDVKVGAAALKVALPQQPGDLPARLAAAMETVLSDREWESRSAAGVNWAAGHIWPAKAAAATQIYREIVKSPQPLGPGN
ncbi:MAG TPA: glycosyltransferase family 4 protein [Streptosporangiaceae bacterium]